jgi:hypothetical protein
MPAVICTRRSRIIDNQWIPHAKQASGARGQVTHQESLADVGSHDPMSGWKVILKSGH